MIPVYLMLSYNDSHHSGADDCSQIWGLIHHSCYDVVISQMNDWIKKSVDKQKVAFLKNK